MHFGLEILIIELIGIIAFAVSGAVVAIKKRFDLFGVIVLGVMTAVGGGALRDITLGVLPPMMFRNSIYVVTAFGTAILAFLLGLIAQKKIKKRKELYLNIINFFDAVGLGVFAVTGTNAAIIHGFGDNAFLCIFVGVVTGIGGGMVRDILAAKVPFVLHKDIYASAAIVGAAMYYFMYKAGLNATLNVSAAIIVTIAIRIAAICYHLSLPRVASTRFKK